MQFCSNKGVNNSLPKKKKKKKREEPYEYKVMVFESNFINKNKLMLIFIIRFF